MIRTQISMTEEQQAALQRLAAARKVSQAAVLREALDALIDHDARLRRLERARRVAGRYRADDGKSYVDHDAALDDAFSA
jgi:Arc/MetJ-type ribon-helix-helix transcriptional regulator